MIQEPTPSRTRKKMNSPDKLSSQFCFIYVPDAGWDCLAGFQIVGLRVSRMLTSAISTNHSVRLPSAADSFYPVTESKVVIINVSPCLALNIVMLSFHKRTTFLT